MGKRRGDNKRDLIKTERDDGRLCYRRSGFIRVIQKHFDI